MGMYDTVVCEYPLPDDYVSEFGFQTKDVYQKLAFLRITADGRLMFGGSELDEFTGQAEPKGETEVAYHGDIVFSDRARTFVARFWRGRVRWIHSLYPDRVSHQRNFLDNFGTEDMVDAGPAFPWRDRDLDELNLIYWAQTWEGFGITEEIAAAYLQSLNQHIAYVRQAGQIIGVSFDQLHRHDQSKFSVEEFPHYARHFFGDKGDPDGWERAWLHHENHNPHHWGHWIARSGKMAGKPLPMPEWYVKEMVADWHGAGRAYQGSWDISVWLANQGPGFRLHPKTEMLVDGVMQSIGYEVVIDAWVYKPGAKFYELFGEPLPGAAAKGDE